MVYFTSMIRRRDRIQGSNDRRTASRENGPYTRKVKKPARGSPRTKATGELTKEQERIIQAAATYCLRNFPMLWTTGGLPEECHAENGARQWLVHIFLRYPMGQEGYLGDLLYDGNQFSELTTRQIMSERAKVIANSGQARKGNG